MARVRPADPWTSSQRRPWRERSGARVRRKADPIGTGPTLASPAADSVNLSVDLSVDLATRRPGALVLQNPVLAASGVFGYGVEYAEVVDVDGLGAICCKGTTLAARTGNAPPRIAETAAGLLNSIGLQNPGVEAVIERYAPIWASWEVPVIVNVAAESVEDYATLAGRLDGVPGVAAIELNVSCPNVGRGGLQFALDPASAAAATAAARRATELPLLVKLSAAATDVRGVARAVEAAGADALCAVNTLPGLAIDRERRRPVLGNTYGGLSGPALKPVALRVVYEVSQAVRIPVVGIGGVTTLEDVLDYLMAGASAVQVGTAIFADPTLPLRLVEELGEWCAAHGLASHRDVIGAAHRSGRQRPSATAAEYRP
ncbi:dihydroorotate dehydrogenase [soil metagenome]